ncbi:MAG: response regulator, partial [Magnetococcales bacterium]|nr:response regulator [Magnetococcales bacterium]
ATPFRPAQPLRLLIVDDLEDSLLLFKKFMKELPCKVETAANGQDAVEKFKQGIFDIVLMDMLMPVMDGYTATREIRAWEKEQGRKPVPIIALTANAMKEDAQMCLDSGCDLHLCKPIGKARLIETLAQYCRRE